MKKLVIVTNMDRTCLGIFFGLCIFLIATMFLGNQTALIVVGTLILCTLVICHTVNKIHDKLEKILKKEPLIFHKPDYPA